MFPQILHREGRAFGTGCHQLVCDNFQCCQAGEESVGLRVHSVGAWLTLQTEWHLPVPLRGQATSGCECSVVRETQALLPLGHPFHFPRDLEARAQSELFRAVFRLPRQERLHSVRDCSLWTPFSRRHTAGRLFTSDRYICFASKEEGCCRVILPLREVGPLGMVHRELARAGSWP